MTTLRALPLSGNPIRGLRTNQPLSSLLTSLHNRLEEVRCSGTTATIPQNHPESQLIQITHVNSHEMFYFA